MRDDPIGGAHTPKFLPDLITTSAPSTLRFINDETYTHSFETYYVQGGGTSFASPPLSYTQSYVASYTGGTVLYRSLLYSSLDYRVNPPACIGMCGAVHDLAADPTPPTVSITTPNGFVFTGSVRIDGVAADNRAVTKVRVTIRPVSEIPLVLTKYEGDVRKPDDPKNPCWGCNGPDVKWTFRGSLAVSRQAPILTLPPGQYRVEAVAFDPAGNTTSATPISIYVLQ